VDGGPRRARPLPGGAPGWPYTGEVGGAAGTAPPGAAAPLTMIPYHLWGNRGPASMRVWLPELRRQGPPPDRL
jgi:hypothetical protein